MRLTYLSGWHLHGNVSTYGIKHHSHEWWSNVTASCPVWHLLALWLDRICSIYKVNCKISFQHNLTWQKEIPGSRFLARVKLSLCCNCYVIQLHLSPHSTVITTGGNFTSASKHGIYGCDLNNNVAMGENLFILIITTSPLRYLIDSFLGWCKAPAGQNNITVSPNINLASVDHLRT